MASEQSSYNEKGNCWKPGIAIDKLLLKKWLVAHITKGDIFIVAVSWSNSVYEQQEGRGIANSGTDKLYLPAIFWNCTWVIIFPEKDRNEGSRIQKICWWCFEVLAPWLKSLGFYRPPFPTGPWRHLSRPGERARLLWTLHHGMHGHWTVTYRYTVEYSRGACGKSLLLMNRNIPSCSRSFFPFWGKIFWPSALLIICVPALLLFLWKAKVFQPEGIPIENIICLSM